MTASLPYQYTPLPASPLPSVSPNTYGGYGMVIVLFALNNVQGGAISTAAAASIADAAGRAVSNAYTAASAGQILPAGAVQSVVAAFVNPPQIVVRVSLSPSVNGSTWLYGYYFSACLDPAGACVSAINSATNAAVPGAAASAYVLDIAPQFAPPTPFPSAIAPVSPSLGPNPAAPSSTPTASFASTLTFVARADGRLRLFGLSPANVTATNAANAVTSAVSSDMSVWIARTVGNPTMLLIAAPIVSLDTTTPAAAGIANAVDALISLRVYNAPQVAGSLAAALTAVLQPGPLQAPTLASALPAAQQAANRTVTAGLIGPFTAVQTDSNGNAISGSALPSPRAATQTTGSVSIAIRLGGVSLAQLQAASGALQSSLKLAAASAVAAALKTQTGIDVPASAIAVTLAAATGRLLEGDGSRLLQGSTGVLVTSDVPVPQSVPGLTSMYAQAVEAALVAAPGTLLAGVVSAAVAAAPGASVTATVTGASGSANAPAGSPTPAPAPGGPSGPSVGAIVGGVVGGLVVLAIAIGLAVWFTRRRHAARGQKKGLVGTDYGKPSIDMATVVVPNASSSVRKPAIVYSPHSTQLRV